MTAEEPDYLAALSAVMHDLDGQRRRLDELAQVREHVAELALTVRELSTRAASAGPPPSRALSWLGWHTQREEPADPAAADLLLRNLTSWLNRVFLRYTDAGGVLPECWLWHPDAVEELLCLWQAWRYAYAASSITSAADWHERLRPGVVRRLRAGLAACSFESHVPGDHRRPGERTATTSGHIALIAAWWTADPHRKPPSPVLNVEAQ
jgi:hypothetical protein